MNRYEYICKYRYRCVINIVTYRAQLSLRGRGALPKA